MKSPRSTLIIRIPSSLHRRLKQEARAADISLNRHCCMLLSRETGGVSEKASPVSLSIASGNSPRTALLQGLLEGIIEAWGSDITGLVLFGSFARGRETASSDIDLLVVLAKSVVLDRDIYDRWQSCKIAGREVAPLFVQIPEDGERISGLWFEVALEGIVLFDKDLHLSRFLSRVRELVAGGRVRRLVTHGHPYWVHTGQSARTASPVRDS